MEEQGRQGGGALVGYLVTTDRTRFDIDRIHELLRSSMNDPRLQNLRRWMLVTSDAHELYRKFGFCEVRKPERFMERVIVNAYG